MKSKRVVLSIVAASVCAFALVVAVGCSSSSGSGSAAASSSASSASASSASTASSSATSASSTASSASQQSSSGSVSTGQLTEEQALAAGYQVFKGTVRVCTAEELIALQAVDIDPAAAGGGGTYAVLVFDEPTQITGESADGSGQRTETAKMLGIAEHTDYSSFVIDYGDLDLCKSLDGQQKTVATMATDVMFPSDVRLPIGEPSSKNVVFL